MADVISALVQQTVHQGEALDAMFVWLCVLTTALTAIVLVLLRRH